MHVSTSLRHKEECLPETEAIEEKAWSLLQLKESPKPAVLVSVLSFSLFSTQLSVQGGPNQSRCWFQVPLRH